MSEVDDFVALHADWARETARALRAQLGLENVELGDLYGYAFQGLLDARQRFDPNRRMPFARFAHYRVRGAIIDGLRKLGRLPRGAHRELQRLAALDAVAERTLELRDEEQPSLEPAGAMSALNVFVQQLAMSLAASATATAEVSPEDAMITEIDKERLRKELRKLPERDATLVRGMYYEGRNLGEIAVELGVSPSRASHIHTEILQSLAARLT